MFWNKGSYTIEASIWVPTLLFCVTMVLRIGIALYEEIAKAELVADEMDIVQEFYNYQILGELGEQTSND